MFQKLSNRIKLASFWYIFFILIKCCWKSIYFLILILFPFLATKYVIYLWVKNETFHLDTVARTQLVLFFWPRGQNLSIRGLWSNGTFLRKRDASLLTKRWRTLELVLLLQNTGGPSEDNWENDVLAWEWME